MVSEVNVLNRLHNKLMRLELTDSQEIALREKILGRIQAALKSQQYPQLPATANLSRDLGFYRLFIQEIKGSTETSVAEESLFLKVRKLASLQFDETVKSITFKETDSLSKLDIECVECDDLDGTRKAQPRETYFSKETDFFALLGEEEVTFENLTTAMLQTYEYKISSEFKGKLDNQIYYTLQYTFMDALNSYNPKLTHETFGEYFVQIWDKEMRRIFDPQSNSLENTIKMSDRQATKKIEALRTMIRTTVDSASFQQAFAAI